MERSYCEYGSCDCLMHTQSVLVGCTAKRAKAKRARCCDMCGHAACWHHLVRWDSGEKRSQFVSSRPMGRLAVYTTVKSNEIALAHSVWVDEALSSHTFCKTVDYLPA